MPFSGFLLAFRKTWGYLFCNDPGMWHVIGAVSMKVTDFFRGCGSCGCRFALGGVGAHH